MDDEARADITMPVTNTVEVAVLVSVVPAVSSLVYPIWFDLLTVERDAKLDVEVCPRLRCRRESNRCQGDATRKYHTFEHSNLKGLGQPSCGNTYATLSERQPYGGFILHSFPPR